jgi:hypothetical protein
MKRRAGVPEIIQCETFLEIVLRQLVECERTVALEWEIWFLFAAVSSGKGDQLLRRVDVVVQFPGPFDHIAWIVLDQIDDVLRDVVRMHGCRSSCNMHRVYPSFMHVCCDRRQKQLELRAIQICGVIFDADGKIP